MYVFTYFVSQQILSLFASPNDGQFQNTSVISNSCFKVLVFILWAIMHEYLGIASRGQGVRDTTSCKGCIKPHMR